MSAVILLLLLSAAIPLALMVALAVATDKAPPEARQRIVYYVQTPQAPQDDAPILLLEAPEVTR